MCQELYKALSIYYLSQWILTIYVRGTVTIPILKMKKWNLKQFAQLEWCGLTLEYNFRSIHADTSCFCMYYTLETAGSVDNNLSLKTKYDNAFQPQISW